MHGYRHARSIWIVMFLVLFVVRCSDKSTTSNQATTQYRINDLSVSIVASNQVKLTWLAPGGEGSDEQATRYYVRYSEDSLLEDNWSSATAVDSAPVPETPSTPEELIVTGDRWQHGQSLYFGIKASFEPGGLTELSNIAVVPELEYDVEPPASISTLRITNVGPTSVSLIWASSGDDSYVGIATEFDLRYSESPINVDNFSAAEKVLGVADPLPVGEFHEHEITGLEVGTKYYFAIRAIDNMGNISDLSPELSATTLASLGITWTGTIESEQMAEGWKIIPSHRDGFVIGGMILDTQIVMPQTFVAEISSTNVILWKYEKYLYMSDSLSDIIAYSDGTYLVTGNTISPSYYGSYPFLLKLNQTGAVVDQKSFQYEGSFRSLDVLLETPGRSVLALGTYYDGNLTDQWAIIITPSFNSSNSQIYAYFHLDNACPDAPTPIAEADCHIMSGDNSGTLVAWSATHWPDWSEDSICGPEAQTCLLSRLNSSQNMVWQKTYGTDGARFQRIIAISTESYAALLWEESGQKLLIIDDDGIVTGESQLSAITSEGYHDLALTSTGNILLVGKIGIENRVLVLDHSGNNLDSITLPGEQNQKLLSVAVSASGEIMATGWREDAEEDRDILLVRIETQY